MALRMVCYRYALNQLTLSLNETHKAEQDALIEEHTAATAAYDACIHHDEYWGLYAIFKGTHSSCALSCSGSTTSS